MSAPDLIPGDAGPLPRLKPPRHRTLRTITALMLREMASTYGASPGGYVWAVLQPIGMLIILSVAFSLVMRSPSLGTSFILFYATGYMPYVIYVEIANKTGASLNYARALLAYPSVTWADAVLARFLLNMITNAMVFIIVMTGILWFVESRTVLDPMPVITAVLMAGLLGLGVGLCNAIIGGLFPVWTNVWRIVTRPLFLASAVIYIYEDLPAGAQSVLWFNPVVHVTGWSRTGFFPTYEASYVSLTYGFGVALALMFIGLVFMRAHYTKVLEQR